MADFSMQLVAYDAPAQDIYGWRFTVSCDRVVDVSTKTTTINWQLVQEPAGNLLNQTAISEVGLTTLTINGVAVYSEEHPSIIEGWANGNTTGYYPYGSVTGTIQYDWDDESWERYTDTGLASDTMDIPVVFTTGGETVSGTFRINGAYAPFYILQNPAQIGGLAACVVTTDLPSLFTCDISYSFGDKYGTVVEGAIGPKVYTWTIPEDFYDELPADASSMRGTLTATTYYDGDYYGECTTEFIAATFADDVPEITVELYDTDSEIVALTGNNGIVVPGYSDIYYSMTATAKNGANIKSVKASGDVVFPTTTGTFENTRTAKYVFYATDTRELVGTKTVIMPMVDYVKPTVNIADVYLDGTGELTFTISGNSFGGSFGAVDNALVLQYRIKVGSGSYGDWVTVSTSFGSKSYYSTITISGLDYQGSYFIQARIQDSLNEMVSEEIPINSKPIFDWSSEDFNFNVPVNVNGDVAVSGASSFSGDVAFNGRTSGLQAADIEGLNLPHYATCMTANSEYAKEAECSGLFTLSEGASIRIKFFYGNSATSPTLNVNNTGAYPIRERSGVSPDMRYKWSGDGAVKDFVFDGTYWLVVDGEIASEFQYGKTMLTSVVDATTNKAVTPSGVQQAIAAAMGTAASVGTWTPSCYGTGTKTGWYVKIGEMVILGFYIKVSSTPTELTELSIGGVPFTLAYPASGGGTCYNYYYPTSGTFTGWQWDGSYIKAIGATIPSFGSADTSYKMTIYYPASGTLGALEASGTICGYIAS